MPDAGVPVGVTEAVNVAVPVGVAVGVVVIEGVGVLAAAAAPPQKPLTRENCPPVCTPASGWPIVPPRV